MLTIRDAQVVILREDRRAAFERHLASELARHYPRLADPEEGAALVRIAVQSARRHGILGARDMARFVNIAAALGPEFDSDPNYPWAALILSQAGMPPSQKVSRLCYWANRTLAAIEHGAS